LSIPIAVLFVVPFHLRNGFFRGLGLVEDPGVDVQLAVRVGELVDVDLFSIKGVFDASGRLRAVGDSDHDRRCFETGVGPGFCSLAPVVAEKVIAVRHEIGQGFLWLRFFE
jgi:hypothetical protein